MQYRFVNARIECRYIVWKRGEDRFRTLEFKKGVMWIFLQQLGKKTAQKLAYPTEYLSNYRLSAFVVVYMWGLYN